MSDNKEELKKQFIASAQITEDGNTINVGSFTARKQESGILARLFGISTWKAVLAQPQTERQETQNTYFYSTKTWVGRYKPQAIINELADRAAQFKNPPPKLLGR